MKILVIFSFFIIAITADDLDVCIQNKLKLSEPVSHKTIMQDITNGNLKRFRYAARSALQVCHPTYEIVAGQVFKKMMKPSALPSETEVNCYQRHLMEINTEGLLAAQLDRNLLNGFEGDSLCDEIIENFVQSQVSQKMPEGTEIEIACLKNNLKEYMSARFKSQILSLKEYAVEVINDEKQRFVRELRDVSEKLISCIVESNS